jgi:hypothetical protein
MSDSSQSAAKRAAVPTPNLRRVQRCQTTRQKLQHSSRPNGENTLLRFHKRPRPDQPENRNG